jgi:hypothetical protein
MPRLLQESEVPLNERGGPSRLGSLDTDQRQVDLCVEGVETRAYSRCFLSAGRKSEERCQQA